MLFYFSDDADAAAACCHTLICRQLPYADARFDDAYADISLRLRRHAFFRRHFFAIISIRFRLPPLYAMMPLLMLSPHAMFVR